MLIRGGCHCGNISFSLTWEPDPAQIPARACTCSFSSKPGGVWTSNPRGALRIVILNPALVSKYTFGSGNAYAFENVDQSLIRLSAAALRDLIDAAYFDIRDRLCAK
jgi:hypothetical protein